MPKYVLYTFLVIVIIAGLFIANIEDPTIVAEFNMAPISHDSSLAERRKSERIYKYIQRGPIPDKFDWWYYQSTHPDELVVVYSKSVTIYRNDKEPDFQYFKKWEMGPAF